MTVIDDACKAIDARNGVSAQKVLEAIAEVDLSLHQRQALIERLKAAGFSELLGSWLVILGFFTPLGALALTSTMAVAAYQHVLTSGFNIYVLELVLLYLGGSLAILLIGPGRFSFDAGMAPLMLSGFGGAASADDSRLQPAAIPIESR